MTQGPCAWKRGLRRMQPGLYADAEGQLHIDAAELLAFSGYLPTEANQRTLYAAAKEIVRQYGAILHDVDDPN